jgi:hypothetical protein
MDDPITFRTNVVRPVLQRLALWSQVAENLLVGTALQESLLTFNTQQGGGPALGYFQCEPFTHDDIWNNYLKYRATLSSKVRSFIQNDDGTTPPDANIMIENPYYACAIARIKYLRAPSALPSNPDDIQSLGEYYKRWYNTPLGAATVDQFVEKYKKFAMTS